jgi:hypothetical protein
MILVVVKADEKPPKKHGTAVAISRFNRARPRLKEDGKTQPPRREALFASLLAMYAEDQ